MKIPFNQKRTVAIDIGRRTTKIAYWNYCAGKYPYIETREVLNDRARTSLKSEIENDIELSRLAHIAQDVSSRESSPCSSYFSSSLASLNAFSAFNTLKSKRKKMGLVVGIDEDAFCSNNYIKEILQDKLRFFFSSKSIGPELTDITVRSSQAATLFDESVCQYTLNFKPIEDLEKGVMIIEFGWSKIEFVEYQLDSNDRIRSGRRYKVHYGLRDVLDDLKVAIKALYSIECAHDSLLSDTIDSGLLKRGNQFIDVSETIDLVFNHSMQKIDRLSNSRWRLNPLKKIVTGAGAQFLGEKLNSISYNHEIARYPRHGAARGLLKMVALESTDCRNVH